MAQHIETEHKTALTDEQYLKLFQHFNCANLDCIIQENHYFDTAEQTLFSNKSGLRLRITDTVSEFTLKETVSPTQVRETTDYIASDIAKHHLHNGTFPNETVAAQLKQYQISLNQLQKIGYLKNERYEIPHHEGVWVLDKSYFPTGISYELEYEFTNDEESFFNFLTTHGITYTPLPSKMARALSR